MRDGRERTLDLICIGRTCVDLYAEQAGSKLEDVQFFRKYVGGSAANIALNTARLGVKSAMLTQNETTCRTGGLSTRDDGEDARRSPRGRRIT